VQLDAQGAAHDAAGTRQCNFGHCNDPYLNDTRRGRDVWLRIEQLFGLYGKETASPRSKPTFLSAKTWRPLRRDAFFYSFKASACRDMANPGWNLSAGTATD
jgi:hypothetical protein